MNNLEYIFFFQAKKKVLNLGTPQHSLEHLIATLYLGLYNMLEIFILSNHII